jgi:hypothetical protein
MGQGGDRLHFDCVPLIQRSVQNSWRVNTLNPDILKVSMTYIKILCREGHGADLDIGSGEFVDQTRFSNIWETKEENGW